MQNIKPSVCIYTINPQGLYSGGRYLSLILAHSLQRAGANVTYVSDNDPLFSRDFDPYEESAPLRKIIGKKFEVPDAARSEWIIVIPTGSFNDLFYDAALNTAQRWGSRVALLSFETPNWFNMHSPHARSPMPTESWRKVVACGGLVMTIAKDGIEPARTFYGADRTDLAFDYWHPPINDLAAAQARRIPDPRRVVAFVRTQDQHKGAHDLLALDPMVFTGHILSLVFGRGVDDAYVDALARHFADTPDFRIEIHDRITDLEKFELLAKARLLLFPSYFEGYGYPPVEAAWMGVPSLCYDLPVVRETIGDAGLFVPPGDTGAFSAAIAKLLQTPFDASLVRDRLLIRPDTLSAGAHFLASLKAAARHVQPLSHNLPVIPIPSRDMVEPARLRTILAETEGSLRIHNLQARIEGDRIAISGSVEGTIGNERLRFTFPQAIIPDVRLGDGIQQLETFTIMGHVSGWKTDRPRQDCAIDLLDARDESQFKAAVTVEASPELLLERSARFEEAFFPINQGLPLLIRASLRTLIDDPVLSLSLAHICGGLAERHVPTRLLTEQDRINWGDTDFLPHVDKVELLAPDAQDQRMADHLARGGWCLEVSPAGRTPATSRNAGIFIQGRSAQIHLYGPTPPSRALRSAIKAGMAMDHILLARRHIAAQRARPALILSADGPLETLPPMLPDMLTSLRAAIGDIQVLLPHRFGAVLPPDCLPWGEDGTIRLVTEEEQADLAKAMNDRIAGLHIGDGPTDPIIGHLLREAGGASLAWVQNDRNRAALMSRLIDLLSRPAFPSPAVTALAESVIGKNAPLAAPTAIRLPAPVKPTRLPSLNRIDSLCFAAPRNDAADALAFGWSRLTIDGAILENKAGIIRFNLAPEAVTANNFQLLVRAFDEKSAEATYWVRMNGRLIGTIHPQKVGCASFSFEIAPECWNSVGHQELVIANPSAARISLGAVAISDETPQPIDWPSLLPDVEERAMIAHALPRSMSFAAESEWGKRLAGYGWGGQEDEGRWSVQRQAVLRFPNVIRERAPLYMRFRGRGYIPGRISAQRIGFHCFSPTPLATTQCTPGRDSFIFAVPLGLSESGFDAVSLSFPDALSPFSICESNDNRELGFFLTGLDLEAAQPLLAAAAIVPDDHGDDVCEIPACEGVLRLVGRGTCPPSQSFAFAIGGSPTTVVPFVTGPDSWEACLWLDQAQAESGRICIDIHGPYGVPANGPMVERIEMWPASDSASISPGSLTVALRSAHNAPGSADHPPGPFAPIHLGRGWSTPEESHVWSESLSSIVHHATPLEGDAMLTLTSAAFVTDRHLLQRHRIAQGKRLLASIFDTAAEPRTRLIPLPAGAEALDHLVIQTPDAVSPAALAVGQDERMLGIRLLDIGLEPIAPARQALAIEWSGGFDDLDVRATALASGDVVLELHGIGNSPPGLVLEGSDVLVHPTKTTHGWRALLMWPQESLSSPAIVRLAEEANGHPSIGAALCQISLVVGTEPTESIEMITE